MDREIERREGGIIRLAHTDHESQTLLNIQRYTPITVDQTAPFETRKI